MTNSRSSADKAKLVAKIGVACVALCAPLVAYYEGTITRTYRDPVSVLTACTGHTGPELRDGQVWTLEQCDQMLYADLLKHADALDCIETPMSDGQKAAFLSFAFNVGETKFCKSTLVRRANAGDYAAACAELSKWTYAGGRELPGLIKRRAAERQMCEASDAPITIVELPAPTPAPTAIPAPPLPPSTVVVTEPAPVKAPWWKFWRRS